MYSATLRATGGGNYQWSSDLPVGSGNSLSDDGVLSAVVEAEISFDATVTDTATGCVSEPQRFTVPLLGEGATACPTIYVEGKPSGFPAPASCKGWPYAAKLGAEGGEAPYTWTVWDEPRGLDFERANQVLSGTATDSGTLTVDVTDDNDRVVRTSLSIPLREKCWLGYISNDAGTPRLSLVDPLLLEPVPEADFPGARLQRPSPDSTDLSVEDFQFSPDGRFVAYRVRDAAGVCTLWLWQGPTWDHQEALDLHPEVTGESVTHYAWSDDGSVLAAAMESGGNTWLGGVKVDEVPAAPTVDGIQGMLVFDPLPAPAQSEITWYGRDSYVAFHSPSELSDAYRVVHYASLAASEFSDLVSRGSHLHDPSLVLHSSDLGFFVLDPVTQTVDFIALGSSASVSHGNVAVDPDGTFVATVDDDSLRIYRAADPADTSVSEPWAEAEGCGSLLTWAGGRERLACANDGAGTIQIHDLTVSSDASPITTTVVTGSSAYLSSAWQGWPRLMSPDGEWLALTTNDRLFMAALDSPSPRITWSAELDDQALPTDLSFSPDARLLMLHRGATVELFGTESPDTWASSGSIEVSTGACQEELLWQPDWCGTVTARGQPVWSTDSQLLGMVHEDRSLTVLDLRSSRLLATIPEVLVDPECDDRCAGTARFQP